MKSSSLLMKGCQSAVRPLTERDLYRDVPAFARYHGFHQSPPREQARGTEIIFYLNI